MTQFRITRASPAQTSALLAAASLLGLGLGCQSAAASDGATPAADKPAVSHQTKVPAPSGHLKVESAAAPSVHQKTYSPSPWNQQLSPQASNQTKWPTSAPPPRAARAEINPQPLPPKLATPPKTPPKAP